MNSNPARDAVARRHQVNVVGEGSQTLVLALFMGGMAIGSWFWGAVADAALAAGGEVIGIIPQALVDAEVAHRGCTELRVVSGMHERKALFTELSDGFVTLEIAKDVHIKVQKFQVSSLVPKGTLKGG